MYTSFTIHMIMRKMKNIIKCILNRKNIEKRFKNKKKDTFHIYLS